MKIGLISLRWDGHHTPYADLISRSLIELGHNVVLYIPENHAHKNEFEPSEQLEIVELQSSIAGNSPGPINYVRQNIRYYNQINAILKNNQIEVLHFLTLDLLQLPLLLSLFNKKSNVPIVGTIHRDHPFRNINTEAQISKNNLRSLVRKVLQLSIDITMYLLVNSGCINKLLTHSGEMRDRLTAGFFSIPSNKITDIPAPSAPISEDISQITARQKLKLPENKPLILFFGEMRKEKGPDILIRALKNVNQECTVVFAGEESYIKKETIEKSDVSSTVEIDTRFEYIPEDHLNCYFIAADLLVLPYRREKGISGPLRQAVMANTAIIASHPTDIGSIVKENNIGEVFNICSAEDLSSKINQYLRGDITISNKDLDTYSDHIHYQSVGEKLDRVYYEII